MAWHNIASSTALIVIFAAADGTPGVGSGVRIHRAQTVPGESGVVTGSCVQVVSVGLVHGLRSARFARYGPDTVGADGTDVEPVHRKLAAKAAESLREDLVGSIGRLDRDRMRPR